MIFTLDSLLSETEEQKETLKDVRLGVLSLVNNFHPHESFAYKRKISRIFPFALEFFETPQIPDRVVLDIVSNGDSPCKLFFFGCTELSEQEKTRALNNASISFEKMREMDPQKQKPAKKYHFLKSGNQVVQTPKAFYQQINDLFNFDYDPCPIKPDYDAMKTDWGRMNFVNPPFKHVEAFLLRAEALKTKAVFLIPCFLKRRYLQRSKHIIHSIIFLRTGLKFDGYTRKYPNPLALVLLAPGRIDTRREFIPAEFWDHVDQKNRKNKSAEWATKPPLNLINEFKNL